LNIIVIILHEVKHLSMKTNWYRIKSLWSYRNATWRMFYHSFPKIRFFFI